MVGEGDMHRDLIGAIKDIMQQGKYSTVTMQPGSQLDL